MANNKILINDKELNLYGSTGNLSEKASALLNQQKQSWTLLRNNFEELQQIKIKLFDFRYYKLKLQFNPARIKSSSAKVDKQTIERRQCFLCKENLPDEQKGILYNNKYILLCNPYPIFKEHLTIPSVKHIPQRIENSFEDLLQLSYDLRHKFFLFYNGPNCGASAPDHLHFQAAIKNSTPLEEDYKTLLKTNGKEFIKTEETNILSVTNCLRNFIYIATTSKQEAANYFSRILNTLATPNKKEAEPKLNIVSFYERNKWHVFIFPRKLHRPKEYFYDEENKILFSPAAAEMTGICITPRKEDFNKIQKDTLTGLLQQVTFDKEELEKIVKEIK